MSVQRIKTISLKLQSIFSCFCLQCYFNCNILSLLNYELILKFTKITQFKPFFIQLFKLTQQFFPVLEFVINIKTDSIPHQYANPFFGLMTNTKYVLNILFRKM